MQPDYSLLDRGGASAAIFFPRRDDSPCPAGAMDLGVDAAPGVTLGARFYLADLTLPTILYFHGNGEVVADHDGVAPLCHQAGANLLVVDFRGYGRSGGAPNFATLVGDAHPVAAWFHATLNERRCSGRRFVMGRSLGSHPALEIAARQPDGFEGLIIESGAANLRRMVARLGLEQESANELVNAHEAKIRSITLPLLVIHGEQDELIPIEHASALYDLVASAAKEMLVIPGAGHNDLLWLGWQEYFGAIARFVAGRVSETAPGTPGC